MTSSEPNRSRGQTRTRINTRVRRRSSSWSFSPGKKMFSSLFLVVLVVCGLVGAQPGGLPARVEKLEQDNDVLAKSRVAFSAGLSDSTEWNTTGPFDVDTTLKFKRVVTNIGNGYDPETGIFTAPVKGLYFVHITGMVGSSGELNAGLKKNTENMFAIHQKSGTQASASNAMTLALEPGDRLFVQLWKGQTIVGQSRLTTFTAVLVFPL
uniref:C1q domain-containing protein n=1 Tax=Iconisemion striatum TaxID=60296 RepID=A0A1A7XGJ0_9TELE